MTGTYIGKTYTEYRREFVEHFPYGKQIGKFSDPQNRQKRSQAQKPIFLGLESEKSENWIPNFESFEKYLKFAHGSSVQDGSYAFPNELTRFPIEATPIWVEIRKHCKNAVIIQMWLWLLKLKTIKYGTS